MNVYALTETFEKSRLNMIIILRFETIQRKSVFRRVIYSTKFLAKRVETYGKKTSRSVMKKIWYVDSQVCDREKR